MFELRYYQREACDAVWDCLKSRAGNPVICLPTGSGKSLCVAELCRAAVEEYAGRVIVLQHRKELITQNIEKIRALLSGLPVGVYSAGLNRNQINEDIIVAGIQSVHKRAAEFGRRHLVVIDEVHLVQKDGEGMYRTFLDSLAELNPNLRLAGLTATPYRTGEGSICSPSGLFQKICYEAKLPAMIEAGYLCPITSSAAEASVDTSQLHIRAGEFIASEMERLFDTGDHVAIACREVVAKTAGRHSIMVFCAGVIHAGQVANYIESLTGERVGLVTGESSSLERSAALSDFKAKRLRWLINVSVLTTGFDAPCIDAIAVLRATASPGLFAQICGRGLRTDPSKQDCVILDFGQNVARFGPLDSPEYGKRSQRRQSGFDLQPGEPGKMCPGCGEKCAPSVRQCECGFLFPVNHEATADSKQLLSAPITYEVVGVHMNRHRKRGAGPDDPDTLRVTYECVPLDTQSTSVECACGCKYTLTPFIGEDRLEMVRRVVTHIPEKLRYDTPTIPPKVMDKGQSMECPNNWCGKYNLVKLPERGNLAEVQISEWICLDHSGFARTKAQVWWQARSKANLLSDGIDSHNRIDSAIDLWKRGAVASPRTITAVQDGKFYRIVSAVIDDPPDEWEEPAEESGETVDEWGEVQSLKNLPF